MNIERRTSSFRGATFVARVGTAIASTLACLVVGQPALADTFDVTPDNNLAVAASQGALMGVHVGGVVGGIAAPSYLGTGFEMAALTADVALKNTPPILELPDNLAVFPNAASEGALNGFACVYQFQNSIRPGQNVLGDNYDSGVQESFASIFYVPFDPLDAVFGDMGTPAVYHPQADVRVRVNNPYLGGSAYRHLSASDSKRLQKRPKFPAGRHALDWEARTTMNLIMDVTLPSLLIPTGIAAETYLAKRLASSPGRAAFIENGVGLAAEAGLIAADVSGFAAKQSWYDETSYTTAANRATQTLTVWDSNVPYYRDEQTGATNITEQVIEIEATDFGGVRFGRVQQMLRDKFAPEDRCGESFEVVSDSPPSRLFTTGDGPHDLVWEARETNGGPYHIDQQLQGNQEREGENLVTYLTQRISVVDNQAPILVPPAGFARETLVDLDLTSGDFPLGRPQVADLADPAPVVTNDAPASLAVAAEGRRYAITWTATDNQGNATAAPPENPEQYTQIVTLKPPGTNTPPEALPANAATIASQGVEIQLRGNDTDTIDGRFDPLKFEIETYPSAGQFVAPLFPYFIDDFRLTPAGEREDGDNLTRVSPLKHLADDFRLAEPLDRGIYLDDNICNAAPGSLEEQEFGGVIPLNFVYAPSFVYVDDENFYYIRDYFWVCGEGENDNVWIQPETEPVLSKIPRLSKWTDDGEMVAMQPLYPTLSDAHDDTNLDWEFWPEDRFNVEHGNRIWISTDNGAWTTNGAQDFRDHFSFDSNLDDMRTHGRISYSLTEFSYLLGSAGDARANIIYELYPLRAPRSPFRRRHDVMKIRRYIDDGQLGEPASEIAQYDFPFPRIDRLAAADIKVDSKGYVYIADEWNHRIHKLAPTKLNQSGEWETGEYIGWMGRCAANKLDSNNVPYSACDEINQVSYGYACDEVKCEGNDLTDTFVLKRSLSGDAPGQFLQPKSIAIGPEDVLYVADTGNSRVQRFGPDGTFAGEAKSTGTGVNQGDEPGFIIGNMGQPEQVTVNATSFYVMELSPDNGDYFVHVFKTAPFYDLTDNSAKIEYKSNFDFLPNDSFSFYVDDGIDRSPAATVDVSVTRAFNAPERLRAECFADVTLGIDIPCTVTEDAELFIRLSAYDQDGFISTGGYDSLTFELLENTANGELFDESSTDNAAVYRYEPALNFNGADALRYRAFDGNLYSDGDAELNITVTPAPDPVVIEFDDNLKAARGFPSIIKADFSDTDEQADIQASLVSVNWGDGIVATGANWAASGREDLNGREISPQVDFGMGKGMLIGSHNYPESKPYDISVVMDNAPVEGLPPTLATATVNVSDVTVVGVALATPEDAVTPNVPFPIDIEVTNFEPTSWAGFEAGNVQFSFDVPDGLSVAITDGRCSGTTQITCSLGTLAQGGSTTVNLGGVIDLASARNKQVYTLTLNIIDAGPKLEPQNTAALTIEIADADRDGTIDFDDSFPDDSRYQADSDGDGFADQWEIDHGFDPNVANDPDEDSDGDGFTLSSEFANGSFANLAEVERVEAGDRLVSPDNVLEDRFGLAMAGGDLNRDGFADLVIGASNYESSGGVFIAYGGTSGANPSYNQLRPTSGERMLGRALAVGDWDDNDYADVAIASEGAVAIHYNNGEILEVPDLVLNNASTNGVFSLRMMSGDLDGDGIDDLIINSTPGSATTRIDIYGSATGGLDAAPASFTIPLGDHVGQALGDVDGDGALDLILGDPGGALVRGYLGGQNSWLEADGLTLSFQIAGVSGTSAFGWALASGHDVTGDGIDDLVVGAYPGAGSIHLYDSASGYWSNNGAGPLQSINGTDDGSSANDGFGDQFGASLAMGDLDTDGFADLAVGGNRAGGTDDGQVQVLRGSAAGFRADVERIDGTTSFDLLGHNIAIPGDIDGDGFADVAVSASDIRTTQNPAPDGGYVQILYHAFAAIDPAEDIDNDGVRAAVDNCPTNANTDQSDIDFDGTGDVCDADMDGDGIDNIADNCPKLASLDVTDTDNDRDGDLCDADDDNDGVADLDDPFPLNAAYSADSDSDGLPDAYETDNGLNANDPADAAGDLDGDGRSNLDEFNQGFDIASDDVAPNLSVPANILVDSIGPRTTVVLGTATAADAKDGTLSPVPDQTGPFKAGRHLVTWTATDAAGNETRDVQQVDVIPQVGFVGDAALVAEGEQSDLLVALNGDAVTYPVTVPFTVSGSATAGADFTLASGDIVIDRSNFGSIALQTIADGSGEGAESLLISLGSPTNAINGSVSSLNVTIAEGNLPPLPKLSVEQDGRRVTTVTQDGGLTIVSVDPSDPNSPDTHSFNWSSSENALVPQEGFDSSTFTFDAATVAAGTYRIAVDVTDNGVPALTAQQYRYIRVVSAAPVLTPGVDSDGDGIDDLDEELRDSNDNGASDYLDPSFVSHLVVSRTGGDALLQTTDGYVLSLGRVALSTGDDAMVSMMDVESFGDGGGPASTAADTRFVYPAGIFDFEVSALPAAGHTVSVVIPLSAAIPADAVYRKFAAAEGWGDFTIDANNDVASAAGASDACPAPGSSEYTSGLTAGHFCVQLRLEDGGPNDADGVANRVVRDPGGIAVVAEAVAVGATAISVPDKTVSIGSADVVMLRFRLNANSSDVVLNDLTLVASGSGNDSADIKSVKVWHDSNANGNIDSGDTQIGTGSYTANDGELVLQMSSPYRLDAGNSEFIVSYDF